MSSEFQREERYVVIKLKDLSEDQITALRRFIEYFRIETRECAVVEADWPIYEQVWNMIEKITPASEYRNE
jgi:hypothetical protein